MSGVLGRKNRWTCAPIDNIALIEFGTRVTKRLDSGTRYPVYGGGGATFSTDEYNREDRYVISRFGMSEECVRRVEGRFFLNDSGLTVMSRDTNRLHQPYLDIWLLGNQSCIFELGRGAAQKNLNVDAFRQLAVPFPPLDEQKHIVAILDQAFAALDRARANAESNLVDAESLFDTWLTSVFHDHPSSWTTEKLHSLCTQITVGHVGPMAERYAESGIPFLRSQNIRPFELALNDVKRIDEQFHSELAKSALAPGDVAIVRTGYPGTAAVIPESLPVSNCADLVIVRPNKSISAEFLVMFLNSTFGKQMVAEKAVGVAQKHFNVGAAKQVDFSFPKITEQRRIVLQAQKLRMHAQKAQDSYRAKVADIAALRQSLLQAAFFGQLA